MNLIEKYDSTDRGSNFGVIIGVFHIDIVTLDPTGVAQEAFVFRLQLVNITANNAIHIQAI